MSKESFAQEVYSIIGNESMVIYNNEGNVVYDPSEADHFFLKDEQIMVQINSSPPTLEISLSDGVDAKEFEDRYGSKLRKISLNNAYKYMLRTYGRKLSPKDFSQNTPVLETLYGSTKSSYQKIGGAKVIVRHSTAVNEEKRGSRTRNIRHVFVETSDGERFKIPHQNLHAARSIAYHLNNGGNYGDHAVNKMVSIAEDMNELSQQHHDEPDRDRKFWIRQKFLSLREQLKQNYSSNKKYKAFVEQASPKQLEESIDFEQWAVSVVPSDFLQEEYNETIISSYLKKINESKKDDLAGLVNEMIELGIVQEVSKHLTWPIKSIIMEKINEAGYLELERAWQMKTLEIKNHKLSVEDAIDDICKQYSKSQSYDEIREILTDLADESGLMPSSIEDKFVDKILSKNKKLRGDIDSIKAQEFFGQPRFLKESDDDTKLKAIYDLWIEIMNTVGQGMGQRVATDQTISEIMAKYQIQEDEAKSILETALDKYSSK